MKFTRITKSIIAILALLMALCMVFTGCDAQEDSYSEKTTLSESGNKLDNDGIDSPDLPDKTDKNNNGDNTNKDESASEGPDMTDDGDSSEDADVGGEDNDNTDNGGENTDNGGDNTDNGGDNTDNGGDNTDNGGDNTDNGGDNTDNGGNTDDDSSPYKDPICDLLGIPYYSGNPWVAVNGNQPTFTADEITTVGYEFFSELDGLGRCGYVMACVGTEMMPTESRGDIGHIKPTGWVQKQYDGNLVSGGSLYNRCHLIGFQLTGENDNKRNLITGTRYMNWDGMVTFENMIADYVKETGNHVMYRVTPMFFENELVARGVQMEAYSVEDNGREICFNVYAYNVQPGITIEYATGNNWLTENGDSGSSGEEGTTVPEETAKYILNTSSKKVHIPSCASVSQMSDKNKQEYNGTLEDILAKGYQKCGACKAGT